MESHLPKVIDLGEIEISFNGETRQIDLPGGEQCKFTTDYLPLERSSNAISAKIEFITKPEEKSTLYLQTDGSPAFFRLDGKFYKFTPKLPSRPESLNNLR